MVGKNPVFSSAVTWSQEIKPCDIHKLRMLSPKMDSDLVLCVTTCTIQHYTVYTIDYNTLYDSKLDWNEILQFTYPSRLLS